MVAWTINSAVPPEQSGPQFYLSMEPQTGISVMLILLW